MHIPPTNKLEDYYLSKYLLLLIIITLLAFKASSLWRKYIVKPIKSNIVWKEGKEVSIATQFLCVWGKWKVDKSDKTAAKKTSRFFYNNSVAEMGNNKNHFMISLLQCFHNRFTSVSLTMTLPPPLAIYKWKQKKSTNKKYNDKY